jgi:Notch-like protein
LGAVSMKSLARVITCPSPCCAEGSGPGQGFCLSSYFVTSDTYTRCCDGLLCTADRECVDPCNPNPCLNGGACSPPVAANTGVSCACETGFLGDICDIYR